MADIASGWRWPVHGINAMTTARRIARRGGATRAEREPPWRRTRAAPATAGRDRRASRELSLRAGAREERDEFLPRADAELPASGGELRRDGRRRDSKNIRDVL